MGCPQVCATATLQCSFGAALAMLNVLPVHVDVQLGGVIKIVVPGQMQMLIP
ncbi:hypothetical protein PS732_04559 [Pseudomonas fluorescens]|uniref:Uncharacterized protein n=1 Tax=Pseudomonas fluorescens TaxID=294 RepID=A0ABD7VLE1_PSEFL|nr:hypothetical protein PS732_04559 [Pseudomonas fluorescens]